jgi:mannose-1-phosphate guanylyltransferase
MLAATVRRIRPLAEPEDVLVVTGEIIAEGVAKAVPELPSSSILAEPRGRNTAPCVGWAALHVRRRDPDGVMAVLPADHSISEEAAFLDVVRRAVGACEGGKLATIGVTPNRPETGYGYIEVAEELAPGVHKVARFVEKPNLETAKGYLAGGKHVWNSGMFFFPAKTILAEIERQMPELWAGLEEIDAAIERGEETKGVAEVYGRIKGESIDYGIMEGAEEIVVCPGWFGWNDLGSWAAAYEKREGEGDSDGNVALADLVSVGAKGCLAWAEPRKLVALVDVEDLVVVDTEDALLVCPRQKSQKVKNVVDELKARKRSDLL